jgi:hypothetical protein
MNRKHAYQSRKRKKISDGLLQQKVEEQQVELGIYRETLETVFGKTYACALLSESFPAPEAVSVQSMQMAIKSNAVLPIEFPTMEEALLARRHSSNTDVVIVNESNDGMVGSSSPMVGSSHTVGSQLLAPQSFNGSISHWLPPTIQHANHIPSPLMVADLLPTCEPQPMWRSPMCVAPNEALRQPPLQGCSEGSRTWRHAGAACSWSDASVVGGVAADASLQLLLHKCNNSNSAYSSIDEVVNPDPKACDEAALDAWAAAIDIAWDASDAADEAVVEAVEAIADATVTCFAQRQPQHQQQQWQRQHQ